METKYRIQKVMLLLLFYIIGSIALIAQVNGPEINQTKNNSFLPVPSDLMPKQSTVTTQVKIFKGSNVFGNVVAPTSYLYSFDIADPSSGSLINNVNYTSLSGDFRSDDPDNMWIIDNADSYLKKITTASGYVVDSLSMPCPITDGVWTCLTFQKTTRQLYAIATSTVTPDSRLYKINQLSGVATELFELGTVGIISGTFDMYGQLYVFDIYEDNMYSIDIVSQSFDKLGPAGFDGNFAQGMSCDPETNEVYLAGWHEDIGAELRLLDKTTGQTTLIYELPGETTAFGFPINNFSQVYYSVTDVYTDLTIENGDTLKVVGFYTNPDRNLLINYYGDLLKDQIMPPQSYLRLEGVQPVNNSWNGGYIIATGKIQFITNPDPYWSEDTVIAILNIIGVEILAHGSGPIVKQNNGIINQQEKDKKNYKAPKACDSCKFAILISGGHNTDNNNPRYWENLVALYKFKVDSLGYCEDNVFVHYYSGLSKLIDPSELP